MSRARDIDGGTGPVGLPTGPTCTFRRWVVLSVALLAASLLAGIACGGGSPAAPRPQGEFSTQGLAAVEIVRQLTPSVVHVFTETASQDPSRLQRPAVGVGTGIILHEDGYVLTNNHVIADAGAITVTLHDGESYRGLLVGGETNPDIAIIKLDASGLQPANTGTSSDLRVGEDVIAIGHALALSGGPTVSRGVISALGRSIDAGPQDTYVDLIQTDASINPGNSGGPLVNRFGEVIGVNTAAIQGGQGIGFAINIDDALTVSEQLIEKGYVERGFLGIAPVNLTPAIAAQIGVPSARESLPEWWRGADAAGLQGEDVIVAPTYATPETFPSSCWRTFPARRSPSEFIGAILRLKLRLPWARGPCPSGNR